MDVTLAQKIEALLFFRGTPIELEALAHITQATRPDVENALSELAQRFAGGGLRLVKTQEAVELRTAPDCADFIQKIQKEELDRDLGKAGLETLAIILYGGPVTRMYIDYIRGVNSSYILRHLLMRGLIEKAPNPQDNRSYLYRPTTDLLGHLGITDIRELPEYEAVQQELKAFQSEEIQTS